MVEEELIAANESTNDPTTGISNRNGFVAIADHLLSLCKRNHDPASLLIFHLANLQSLEDRHGRYEGDTMALELSHLLMATFRESDIVARTALDTFGVLLADTSDDGAEEARRRFDKVLNARNRDSSRQHEIRTEVYTVAYDESRHKNAEMLLQEGESQIAEALEQLRAEMTASAGRRA